MDPYRFHIMWRRVNEDEFRDFFQTNDIYEAKDFAMRLAFDETNVVYVQDVKRDERVRDLSLIHSWTTTCAARPAATRSCGGTSPPPATGCGASATRAWYGSWSC